MKYGKVALGGTFSKFHLGHLYFIERALNVAEEVIIGISSDVLVRWEGKKHPVEEYEERFAEVYRALVRLRAIDKAILVPLLDPYGPLLEDPEIEALIVSKDSVKKGLKVNGERRKRGLRAIKLILVETVLAEDAKPISSRRIWKGEIDRLGRLASRA